MCWDFGGEERFQKKDGHSEISKTAEIQTEETRIRRGKRSPYTTEEIEEGLKLLLSSTRTYKLLLQKQKETGSITLRLPSIQTCRLRIKGFKCPPGLNLEMLFLMEKKFDSLSCPEDKNCVLSCDEMDLNKKWSYDQRLKRLFPPHKVTMNKYVFKITISLSLFRKSKSASYEDWELAIRSLFSTISTWRWTSNSCRRSSLPSRRLVVFSEQSAVTWGLLNSLL